MTAAGTGPTDAAHRLASGRDLLRAGRAGDALAELRAAAALDPSCAEAWNDIGVLERRAGRNAEAIEAFRRALALRAHAGIALNLGHALHAEGRTTEALEAWQRAASIDPAGVVPSLCVASGLTELGDFAGAEQVLGQAMRRHPADPRPFAQWLSLRTTRPGPGDLARAESLARRPGLEPRTRARLLYALARTYDREGRYGDAYRAARQAQEAAPASAALDVDRLRMEIDGIRTAYVPDLWERTAPSPSGAPVPVLVVGMPRSGTTLTEQILASHPTVHGAGERPELQRLSRSLLEEARARGMSLGAYLASLSNDARAAAGARYLEAVSAQARPGTTHVVDKLPFNFAQVGLFRFLFPHGRVLHCVREPRDVYVSVVFTEFSDALNAFRASPEEYAQYWRLYSELMQHWERVLPGWMLDVRYERVVEDFEPWARRIIGHLGLPWDDACLRFHETSRAVRTPSRWQVRQQIYSGSVGRWRRYGPQIEQALRSLPPPVC